MLRHLLGVLPLVRPSLCWKVGKTLLILIVTNSLRWVDHSHVVYAIHGDGVYDGDFQCIVSHTRCHFSWRSNVWAVKSAWAFIAQCVRHRLGAIDVVLRKHFSTLKWAANKSIIRSPFFIFGYLDR